MPDITVAPNDLVLVLERQSIREISEDDARVLALARIDGDTIQDSTGRTLIRVTSAWLPEFQNGEVVWQEGWHIWPLILHGDSLYLQAEGEFLLLRARDMDHAAMMFLDIRRANTDHRTLVNAENDRHARALTAIHERLEQRLWSLGA